MSDRIAIRGPLTLVGLGLRTNNASEMAGAGKIAAAWKAFIDEQVQTRIVNQVHPTATYAAYYDYASDEKGDYSFVLGGAVRDGTPAPNGMVSVVIPASKYAVFAAATPLMFAQPGSGSGPPNCDGHIPATLRSIGRA